MAVLAARERMTRRAVLGKRRFQAVTSLEQGFGSLFGRENSLFSRPGNLHEIDGYISGFGSFARPVDDAYGEISLLSLGYDNFQILAWHHHRTVVSTVQARHQSKQILS